MTSIQVETATTELSKISTTFGVNQKQDNPPAKQGIRTSLQASTIDGLFAAVFSITTTGILLSNFLVEFDASPIVFGMLSSIPMLVNLVQPLGAMLSERTTSRFWYSAWTYGISRSLWLILVLAIVAQSYGLIDSGQLIILTIAVVLSSHLLGGLGSASWFSWLAMIVPRRLRGRYFGLRNSVASLTTLICVPLAGLAVSKWQGGTKQGYAIVLFIGTLCGLVSLVCQRFKLDINPKEQNSNGQGSEEGIIKSYSGSSNSSVILDILQDSNFLIFLLYFSLWMFAVNLSTPFFNFYMLQTLDLDVSWVTFYGSLQAGANLLMLIIWGRLADKIGNRSILFFVGIAVAITPVLWLGIGHRQLDTWLWLPMLHILLGGTIAAIDLCSNNLQLDVAPIKNQSTYLAIAAAVSGVSGAIGTTIGGFIAQNIAWGGLPGLFVLSAVFRLFGLVPLLFVRERQGKYFIPGISVVRS